MSSAERPGGEEVLAEFLEPGRLARLEGVLASRSVSLTVVLDEVHHPHNISAVIRSADAFGIRDVHLVGDTFLYSRAISLGSERWVELHAHRTADEAVTALKKDGYEIVVTAPEPQLGSEQTAMPVWDLPFGRRLALVFGNERQGVSEPLKAAASLHAFIPMYGFVESLNISVACAISLFCSTFHGAQAGRQLPPLPPEAADALRRRWLRQSTRHSAAILREVARRDDRAVEEG